MSIKIALAGNPNSGKTTLFNELTGSSQYVGNWPGVTVEKKEGKIKRKKGSAIITDLPGIYSLSPYTLEEVIARDYIINEKPDAIINIVDATNLERNLYLTTQLLELGIPVVVALNMIDVVEKREDKINTEELAKKLNCPVVSISAVKNRGIDELMKYAYSISSNNTSHNISFSNKIESTLNELYDVIKDEKGILKYNKRWLSVKILERDEELLKNLNLKSELLNTLNTIISDVESEYDDDIESIMTNERYNTIDSIIDNVLNKQGHSNLTLSDKIDKILTNKILALPIFFLIMWGIYYVSIQTIGDWTIGWVEQLVGYIAGLVVTPIENAGASPWIVSLVNDGIFGGIGGVLVFVPQLMILYFFISLLEDCGYMARVAFIMDRIFRKFGLSGKSFIPMLIGTGCSIPGIMASRTIENDRDRKMTIMLVPFIPCGAKLPVFALFVAMLFKNSTWIGPSMYLIGILMVILSGIVLKRTKPFKGKPTPFIMELPNYKLPRPKGVFIHMWEKGKSFIIKAGTIIFIACAAVWFLQSFDLSLNYLGEGQIENSILANVGKVIAPVFAPLGFGNWPAAVASVTGLIAKEIVVSTFAIIGNSVDIIFTQVSGYAFMIFTLLAAPCFAAIGAIRREMGNWKWTFFAIGFQTGVAYLLAMLINLIGSAIIPTKEFNLATGDIEAAGESALSSTAILENPLVYIIGFTLVVSIILLIKNTQVRNSRLEQSET